MSAPAKIQKLDETVVNRIAAGEIIQRPANALKELIENSLDAKASNIQITVKDGGLKLLQIQDNGTGIRKDDMEIVCERFTTSKLQKFEDLSSIATFGFRGEALASISHVAQLTITTKTALEKCAYKASYIDSKLKATPKSCAGNQGTTITIENLFYNVATRRKALKSPVEELSRIAEVVTRYAVHNPTVGFVLKKHGVVVPEVRTPHNSTKINNIQLLFGNPVARELIEIEEADETYKFKLHGLITNANYSSKRLTFLLFINHRLVDSKPIRKMLEDVYSIYLPKKTHPWCYLSLEINPANVDVNVHPTKHEVRFLHEDSIIDRIKVAVDEKLASNNASRTFYAQSRLPKVDLTEKTLKEVLPEYTSSETDKSKKVYAHHMVRTDSSDQKLEKFNFTVNSSSAFDSTLDQSKRDSTTEKMPSSPTLQHAQQKLPKPKEMESNDPNEEPGLIVNSSSAFDSTLDQSKRDSTAEKIASSPQQKLPKTKEVELNDSNEEPGSRVSSQEGESHMCEMLLNELDSTDSPGSQVGTPLSVFFSLTAVEPAVVEPAEESMINEDADESGCAEDVAKKALKRVYQYLGSRENMDEAKTVVGKSSQNEEEEKKEKAVNKDLQFRSYSVNNFRSEVRLTSVLKLRKEVEDNYHEGLREILCNLIFVGSVDEKFSLVQSGVNLYICNTQKLTEELFYEIMLYDFANYGVMKFSEPLPLYDLAKLALDLDEAGWTEEDGDKNELAENVKELLLEKADMLNQYFSVVIDKRGNLVSLPILLDKYFPYEGSIPMYILRLATEVDWTVEQPCFQNFCRETAKFFSQISPNDGTHDWKHVTEHVLYPAIKDSLLPPKHFAHDSTILQIASLPDLYKVFERC